MDRKYEGVLNKDVVFFVGREIENTPVKDMNTLFVVGKQNSAAILAQASKFNLKHVYLGANKSFNPTDDRDFQVWLEIARALLDKGLWVSLDLDPKWTEALINDGICFDHRRFIPQISVQIPYAYYLGPNATIKIDDKDFDFSNPGVWCHPLKSLMTKESFTDWDDYENDFVCK